MIITIVAGGWSASQFNLARLPGIVIAVNDAARYLPGWDIAISMDRVWTENRFEYLARLERPTYLRRSTLGNVDWIKAHWVRDFQCDHTSRTMAEQPKRGDQLNGTHSGFCALNLAYQMRPQKLYLVGFDMALGPKGERHWFPDYPWKNGGGSGAGKLREWSAQFETAAFQLRRAGIGTYLASQRSAVSIFPRISRKDLEALAACAA